MWSRSRIAKYPEIPNMTQELLRDGPIDFFEKTQYSGNSPDLKVCEDLGAILKQRVQQKISEYNSENTYSKEVLREMITSVLAEMEHSTELFEKLLLMYPKRLIAVEKPTVAKLASRSSY